MWLTGILGDHHVVEADDGAVHLPDPGHLHEKKANYFHVYLIISSFFKL
jgi:hypothetical protein